MKQPLLITLSVRLVFIYFLIVVKGLNYFMKIILQKGLMISILLYMYKNFKRLLCFVKLQAKLVNQAGRLCDERTKDVWEFVSNGKANEDTFTEILLHLKKSDYMYFTWAKG